MASSSTSSCLSPSPAVNSIVPLSNFVTSLPLALNKIILIDIGILGITSYAHVSRSWRDLSHNKEIWQYFSNKLSPLNPEMQRVEVIRLIVLCKQRILSASQHGPITPGELCPRVLRHGLNAHLTLSRINLSNLAEAEKITKKFSPEKEGDPDLYVALGEGYLQANQPEKAVEIVKLISGSGSYGPAPLYYKLVSYYVTKEGMTDAFQLIKEIPQPVLDDRSNHMYLQSIVAVWFGKCAKDPAYSPMLLEVIRHLIKPENPSLNSYIRDLTENHAEYNLTLEAVSKAFKDYAKKS